MSTINKTDDSRVGFGESEREKKAARARAVYWGEQYKHLKPWDADGPIAERRPSVQCRITKQIVDTITAYLVGQGNAPSWDAVGATQNVNLRLQELIQTSRVEDKFSELARRSVLTGTAAIAVHHYGGGRMDLEVLNAETCIPVFGRDNPAVALEKGVDFDDLIELDQYWVKKKDGEKFVYRRSWTLESTISYEAMPEAELGAKPWIVDEERTVVHNLGFVSVAWLQLIEMDDPRDGAAVLGEAEFNTEDLINYTLSQMGRAISYMSEPKQVFVDVGNINESSIMVGASKTLDLKSKPGSTTQARTELLEMQGTGQEAGLQFVNTLRQIIYKAARVVEHSPEQYNGVMSGTALRLLLAPTVAMINDLRPQFEKAVGRLLSKMLAAHGMPGFRVVATWPDVIPWTTADLSMAIPSISTLMDIGLLDTRTAVKLIAPYLGIEDIDAYVAQVNKAEALNTREDVMQRYKKLL